MAGGGIEPIVFTAVLAAAAMHAGWNAVVKARLEPILAMTMVVVAAGLIALPFLLWFGAPRPAAWPFLAASVTLHLLYYLVLSEAYRRADMSQVYPIARGSAPLLTALASITFIGEPLGTSRLLGVLILGGGILLLALHRRQRRSSPDLSGAGFALATGVVICGYTVVDGLGARLAGNPNAYASALFVVDIVPLPAFILWHRGVAAFAPMRRYLAQGVLGGAMSLAAYWIAIWAMTRAPIAVVAALRETGVLFSVVIAAVVLKEAFAPLRAIAAVIIVAGIVLIRW
ncbi:MAG: EamA family transporter [Acetobacteraceae bacterium]